MIIGVSGYIGSGKDTVGEIIQYITEYPNSLNKTDFEKNRSFGSFQIDVGTGHQPQWEIKKFAAKLKEIASLLTGIPVYKFEDQEFKKTFLGPEWDYEGNFVLDHVGLEDRAIIVRDFGLIDKSTSHGWEKLTVREFLQRLGTEGIRNGVHINAWVNALFADYNIHIEGYPELINSNGKSLIEGNNYSMGKAVSPNWIITDCRFPNEAEAIKNRGGIIIRVNRNLNQTIQNHPSETSLDDWNFDYVIDNSSSIDNLIERVREILITEKIIK